MPYMEREHFSMPTLLHVAGCLLPRLAVLRQLPRITPTLLLWRLLHTADTYHMVPHHCCLLRDILLTTSKGEGRTRKRETGEAVYFMTAGCLFILHRQPMSWLSVPTNYTPQQTQFRV
eukprot:2677035-Pyramimonas_sp.AAC.1